MGRRPSPRTGVVAGGTGDRARLEPRTTALAQAQGRADQRRDPAMGRNRLLPRPRDLERTPGLGVPPAARAVPGPGRPDPAGDLPGTDAHRPAVLGGERTDALATEPCRCVPCREIVAPPGRPVWFDLAVQPRPHLGQGPRGQGGPGPFRPGDPALGRVRRVEWRAAGAVHRTRAEPGTHPVAGSQPPPSPAHEKTRPIEPINDLSDITFLRSGGVTRLRVTKTPPRPPGTAHP